jgi:hypothetical protein
LIQVKPFRAKVRIGRSLQPRNGSIRKPMARLSEVFCRDHQRCERVLAEVERRAATEE